MRVSGKSSGAGPVASVGGAKPSGSSGQVTAASSAEAIHAPLDALDVSSTAQFIAVAKVQIESIPDIRTDRVEALRIQLDSEAYHPDGEAVANGLLKEHTPSPSPRDP
jgi:flagellar biosynthesis anti-sigma factor FlgM